jgi:hypothetical protein
VSDVELYAAEDKKLRKIAPPKVLLVEDHPQFVNV